jgi:hypothetical protein
LIFRIAIIRVPYLRRMLRLAHERREIQRVPRIRLLTRADITLAPVNGACFGFLMARVGKSKKARREILHTDQAAAILRVQVEFKGSGFVSANRGGKPYLGTSINHP